MDGRVIAPASAPRRVKRVIEAANRLVEKPYIYGGRNAPGPSSGPRWSRTPRESDAFVARHPCGQ